METDGRPQKRSTSPWIYVGCACGGLVVLALAGIAGMTWWGYRTAKDLGETLQDPEKRAAKTREVLPYETLPAGYHAGFAMTAPFNYLDIAIFTDREPTGPPENPQETPPGGKQSGYDPDFEERGFIYMNMRDFQNSKEKVRRFLRGEAPPPEKRPWVQSNVEFDPDEIIRRGTVDVGGRRILYSASRGEVSRKEEGRDTQGIVTLVMPECKDDRLRFGLWFGRDPDPQKPIQEVDWAGTAADPAEMRKFLGHFGLCGAEK